MLRFLACLVLALLLPVAAEAKYEYTQIHVINATGFPISVDTSMHPGRLEHWGLVKASSATDIATQFADAKYATDLQVYVKSKWSTDPADTICYITKTFANTTDHASIAVRVHYDGHRCSIDSV